MPSFMGFFKLGKLDRGKDKEKEKEKDTDRLLNEQPASSSVAADPGALLAQDRDRKKKPVDEGCSSAAAMPAAGGRSGPGVTTRVQAGLSVNDFISKTKNQQRQGLKPSGPELIAYARYLGIDPVADHDLLWIAVEALEAPLPSDWTEHFDSCDRVFYYNATTRVSSWTHPLEHVYRETYKTIVNFRNSNMSAQERNDGLAKLQAEVRQMDQDTQREVAKWTEHSDEHGNRFYFNKEEKQSTWTDPRPAKCQVLYLKMKMLRLLLSSAAGTPGFVDPSKNEVGRFGSKLGSEFSAEPPSKRQSGGAERTSQERTSQERPSQQRPVAATAPEVIDLSADGAADEQVSPRTSQMSHHDSSDDDSEGGKSKKKKKRKKHKKKKKRHDSDDESPDAAPLRPADSQARLASQPDLGGPRSSGGLDDLGGFGDLGEGVSGNAALGHVKVKAGIRLQPLASLEGASPVGASGAGARGFRNVPPGSSGRYT